MPANNIFKLLIFSSLVLISAYKANSQSEFEIPQDILEISNACAYASTYDPLPGHVIRLGFVSRTPDHLAFFFPDKGSTNLLQMINIFQNAGAIGQGSDQSVLRVTPRGFYVVAQIFIGYEKYQPSVTCLTPPIPLTQYNPRAFGESYAWLTPSIFGR